MSSWWSKIAESIGGDVNLTHGSWERRVAFLLGRQANVGQSWGDRIFVGDTPVQFKGSFTKRITPLTAPGPGPWAKRLERSGKFAGGGGGPSTTSVVGLAAGGGGAAVVGEEVITPWSLESNAALPWQLESGAGNWTLESAP